jgi:large subunit ribosomal protein L21
MPQKRSDELVHVSGVGPAFAKALREAGIDTYAQIAAWTDSDIERYATALGAHAKRIRTDRWVEQARELARTSRAQRE